MDCIIGYREQGRDLVFSMYANNRRQSVIRATFNYYLATSCTVLYHISNDSLYFYISKHTSDKMTKPYFLDIINFKRIFRLLFFEHGYLT